VTCDSKKAVCYLIFISQLRKSVLNSLDSRSSVVVSKKERTRNFGSRVNYSGHPANRSWVFSRNKR